MLFQVFDVVGKVVVFCGPMDKAIRFAKQNEGVIQMRVGNDIVGEVYRNY